MMRILALLLLMVVGSGAVAQTIPGLGGGETAAEASGDTASDPAAASTEALIELLRDDQARAALIERLEASAPAAQSGGSATPQADQPEEEPMTFGRQVSRFAESVMDAVKDNAETLWIQIRRLPNRLSDFRAALDPDIVLGSLKALAFVIFTTYTAYFILRLLSHRVSHRLSAAAVGRRFWQRAALSVMTSVIAALVVVFSVLASSVAAIVFFGETFARLGPIQLDYLTAFNVAGLSTVVIHAIFAPRFGQLRLIPLKDESAKRLSRWLTASAQMLAYGQLLIVPLVQREAGFLPAFAVSSAIGGIVMAYAIVVTWRNRRRVADWLHGDKERPEHPGFFYTLVDLWYVPMTLYLFYVLVIVLLRPGNILLPLLLTSAKVAALVIGGLFLRNQLLRTARRGVTLPPSLSTAMPALERRLNSVLPKITIFLRLVLAIAVVGGVLVILGVISPTIWMGDGDREGITEEMLSITLIVAISAAAWLGVASWVDFRLNPMVGKMPTSRETTLLTLLFNAATIAIVVISTMLILSELGINIAPLLASAGVLGLAIGFGAQKMVQDIITGVFIQFENAINVGDVVSVGGVTGTVEKLTVRSVSLRDVQGVFHIIPFSSVDMVSNYMRDFSYHVADMGVAYREDMEEAKQAMHDAFDELRKDAEQAPDILGDLEWFGLNSFDDSAITLRARIKTVPGKQWAIGRAYNLILKRIFDERNIEIPFPHQTIYFGVDRQGKAPPLHLVQDAVVTQDSGPEPGTRPVTQDTPPAAQDTPMDTPEGGDQR
ncbi:mechanosensitive ion channel domain-containing protein [Oceanibium sediminis]|uniref:mechanosensitive ion channel domain-containing protein n=1 Tax=Oceanibium sediminis TaxID=2026339 RepID=UPI0013007370|nr:mechanosensitive ion channel domain-containing protein [Oceanibium sediminis]